MMLNLIRNEWMKMFSRPRSWILLGLLVFFVLLQALVTKGFTPKQIEDTFSAWTFALEASEQSPLVLIFTLIIAGDIIASEYELGTVKMLLVRPFYRSTILASKLIATLLFGTVLLALLFSSSYLLGGILFGFDGSDQFYNRYFPYGSGYRPPDLTKFVALNYGLRWLTLVVYTSFGLMLSAWIRNSTIAITAAILVLLSGHTLIQILYEYGWAKYMLFANTDLTAYFGGIPPVPGVTFAFSLMMLGLYFVLFYGLTWVAFSKRDVA
ncbi:ABC transporter permease [Brevibacillus dissolubilis]|uniref:ABC transporter permease n=1 Tax=Brevibacillus dissolubilis TaxID=1844116 RepID=UPI001115D1B2|nr:ABC transporter permease [Brevibacillus dissolubilis]